MNPADLAKSPKGHLVLLVLIGLATYAASIPNGFALDDAALLLNNSVLHELTFANLARIILPSPGALEYLPVRDLFLMVEYAAWGANPLGYHVVNVLLYILLLATIYGFLTLLFAGDGDDLRPWCFGATALFAVHPSHVEVVASISQRKDLLSALFLFLALFLFRRYRKGSRIRWYLASVAAGCLSLLSKGTAASLPALVFLCGVLFPLGDGKDSWWRNALWSTPFLVVAALVSLINVGIFSKSESMNLVMLPGLGTERLYAVVNVFRYLWMFVFPWPLSIFPPALDPAWERLPVAASAASAGTLALAAACWRLRKSSPHVSFGIGWYLLALLPPLLFRPYTEVNERYLFLPSFGLCVTALFGARVLLPHAGRVAGRGARILFPIILAGFLIQSEVHNTVWKDDITLLSDALKHDPSSFTLVTLLGRNYYNVGRYDEAFDLFRRAKTMAPFIPTYEFYDAQLRLMKGDAAACLKILDAIPGGPGTDIVDIQNLYGEAYHALGKDDQALESFRRAMNGSAFIFPPYYTREHAQEAYLLLADLKGLSPGNSGKGR